MTLKSTNMRSFFSLSDAVSLSNMSCGFISILLSINSEFNLSCVFMILAIMFDSVDGWVARQIGRNDEYGFGKNIDSLSDIVSFGLAPAIFLYMVSKATTNSPELIIAIVSLVMVMCGVLRLTRYNATADYLDFKGFIGFPIPTISIMLVCYYLSGLFNIYIGAILMFIIALFMISNFKYPRFNNIPFIVVFIILMFLTLIAPKWIAIFNINLAPLLLLIMCLGYMLRSAIN